jgi:hypothetical protein
VGGHPLIGRDHAIGNPRHSRYAVREWQQHLAFRLPEYALRTTLRMRTAMIASLMFTVT